MDPGGGFRCDIPSLELLQRLVAEPLPLGLRAGPTRRVFHRDVYFDTADHALERRGLTCRLRYRSDDRRELALTLRGRLEDVLLPAERTYEADVAELEPAAVFAGPSEPARRLRAFADLARLKAVADLETERVVRLARPGGVAGWFSRPRFEIAYDIVSVSIETLTGTFQELAVRRLRPGPPHLDVLSQAFRDGYGLRPVLVEPVDRAQALLRALETQALARAVQAGRAVALLAVREGRVALFAEGGSLRLPVAEGSGEDACRHLLQAKFGSAAGRVALLGTVPGTATRPALEVWLARPGAAETSGALEWLPLGEVIARVGSPALRDPPTLAALALVARSDLVAERPAAPGPEGAREPVRRRLSRPVVALERLDPARPAPEQFINAELSTLEFNARLLALAEDPRVPLLERVRFLSIFSANLDEFFVVRVGALKQALAEGSGEVGPDGLTAQEQLEAIAVRVRQLLARQASCLYEHCLPALAAQGVAVRRWQELDERQRAGLRAYFEAQIFPLLTPRAITLSPGHPFPHIRNLALSLAVMVRDPRTGPHHFVHLRIPPGTPRFVPLPEGAGAGAEGGHVPVEEVIRANLDPLYPGRAVESAFAFRVARSGDLQVDEQGAGDLLRVVEEEVQRRPFQAVVRLEAERAMPPEMRELLLRELRLEKQSRGSPLGPADVYEVDGLLDLAALRHLAERPRPDLLYPPFHGRAPLPADRSIFGIVAEGDVLVHHPYDAFEATVERFFLEAADDSAVQSIKVTLYRAGGRSVIVDALLRAAAAGKDVSVFVEVKARFDEQRNIESARRLEAAGIHVVYGLVDFKTHAKVALAVRREPDAVRRYVHIGTGNYNAATARFYTDFGLLSADPDLAADVGDLFNELTGSSRPPQAAYRRILVAPTYMRARFIELIDREAEHARAGRGGRVRVKLNGLADAEIIAALYRAAQAGVEIELVVRGLCCLRPGVPGLSESIRVSSILGRFLEHGRIYAFANGGEPEYYIGSADWRPRNLRRRVEVVAPVLDAACRDRLERILATELADPTAWELGPDGSYARRTSGDEALSAQERFMREADVASLRH